MANANDCKALKIYRDLRNINQEYQLAAAYYQQAKEWMSLLKQERDEHPLYQLQRLERKETHQQRYVHQLVRKFLGSAAFLGIKYPALTQLFSRHHLDQIQCVFSHENQSLQFSYLWDRDLVQCTQNQNTPNQCWLSKCPLPAWASSLLPIQASLEEAVSLLKVAFAENKIREEVDLVQLLDSTHCLEVLFPMAMILSIPKQKYVSSQKGSQLNIEIYHAE
jgi:hypothetical protein